MFGKRILLYLGGFLIVLSANTVAAFRNCNTQDSDAWSASTRYTVGEISFDAASGLASGTETNYNYSNAHADGIGECHVTYELSGTYVPVVEVFVLNARRSITVLPAPTRYCAWSTRPTDSTTCRWNMPRTGQRW
ncbi:MAG: hypothetical protein IPG06_18000 [Haliea sp.]|nr:hypothetical protein [Haliea sp.]